MSAAGSVHQGSGSVTGTGRFSKASFLGLLGVYALAHWELWGRLSAPTFGWRPTDLAGIALNYYRNGFHFFYPQVMWGGAGAGHVEMEFPLQPFLTAVMFKLFGVHDVFCEVLPFAFGFGIVWVVAEMGRYLFGRTAGLAAAVSVALSPTLVYITTFGMWADPPMVFCGTLGLYLLTRWSDGGSARQLWAGVAFIALAILFKITGLYLGIVVLWLFYRRYGLAFVKQPTTWLAAAGMLLPPALWYAHSYRQYLEDGNTFGIIGPGYLKLATRQTLMDLDVYRHTIIRSAVYHLTPLGFAAFVYGTYLAVKRRQGLLLVWLAAVAVHALVALDGLKYGGHIGYLLTILPVCNLAGGLGFQTLVEKLRERLGSRWQPRLVVPLAGALAVLVAVNTAVASQRFNHRDLSFETALWEKKRLTGLKVKELTRPGSLIIVVDHEMDDRTPTTSMTPPDVFFFGDRRGWYLSLAWVTSDKIEELRSKGAQYFVVSAQSLDRYQTGHDGLHQYLDQHFRKVSEEDGIIYDLTTR